MNFSDEFYAALIAATKVADEMGQQLPCDVRIETPDGDLLEIDSVYWSPVGGGQIRIKGLAYDDEFDEAEAAEEDAEEAERAQATFEAGRVSVSPIVNLPNF